ncbi:hypothetical protein PTBPS01_14175 [Burkholderia pseudomallei]|nr:hypothetical protein PTBPS01_14175 [Burkholderia pseudomallei]
MTEIARKCTAPQPSQIRHIELGQCLIAEIRQFRLIVRQFPLDTRLVVIGCVLLPSLVPEHARLGFARVANAFALFGSRPLTLGEPPLVGAIALRHQRQRIGRLIATLDIRHAFRDIGRTLIASNIVLDRAVPHGFLQRTDQQRRIVLPFALGILTEFRAALQRQAVELERHARRVVKRD